MGGRAAIFQALVTALCLAGAVIAEVKRPIGLDLLSILSGRSQSWPNSETRTHVTLSTSHSNDSPWMLDEEANGIPLLTDKTEQWSPEQSEESNDFSWKDGNKKSTMEFDSDPSNEGIERNDYEDFNGVRLGAEKRSAVLASLHGGRRLRRGPQPPSPAPGKAVTPFVSVGFLQHVGNFFGSLRQNLETVASLSPGERAMLHHQEPPTVLFANAGGTVADGAEGGFRRINLHALRPLHPSNHIRSLPDPGYHRANQYDPGLLWIGLGRRKR